MESYKRALYYSLPFIGILLLRVFIPNYISDDAYITLSTVKHSLEGHGFTFNPGEYVYVITNPLWAFGIAMISWPGIDPAWALRFLGFLCEGGLFLMMVALGYQMWGNRKWGVLWALLLFFNPVFLFSAFKGMETPLYLLIIISSVYFFEKRQFNLAIIIASLAIWVRFDGIILIGIIVLLMAWKRVGHWQFWALAAGIVMAYFAFGELYYGEWIPNSVKKKAISGDDFILSSLNEFPKIGLELLNVIGGKCSYWYKLPLILIITYPFILIGLITLLKDKSRLSKLPLIFWISLIYGAALLFSGKGYAVNFPWYFVPFLPGIYFTCIEGIRSFNFQIYKFLNNTFFNYLKRSIYFVFIIAGIFGLVATGYTTYNKFKGREKQYAVISKTINDLSKSHMNLLTNEVGATRYFLDSDHYVVDFFGLARPEHVRGYDLNQLCSHYNPEVIFYKQHFSLKDRMESNKDYHWFTVSFIDFAIKKDWKVGEQFNNSIKGNIKKLSISNSQWYDLLFEKYRHYETQIKKQF